MKIEFVNPEVLRVGSGDTLVVKIPAHMLPSEIAEVDKLRLTLEQHLARSLGDRYILVLGDVELGLVEE